MRKGKPGKVKWFDYRTTKFDHPDPRWFGAPCGAYALHAITKRPLSEIKRLVKDPNGSWSTQLMFKYLRKHGFKIIPVTFGNVVEGWSVKDGSGYDKPKITIENVLLIEQGCYREENTWAVIHNNTISHSGEVKPLFPLEFVNYPLEAAYLVYHKSWR